MQDPRFPTLSPTQVSTLQAYGTVEEYPERTRIFTLGDTQYDFFLILQGSVTIEDPYNNSTIVEHLKFEFTGDSGMLSNRAAQFHAYTTPDTVVLRVKPDRLRQAIAKYSKISDILLNAFLLRQETVLNEIPGGLKLVGSGHSPATYSIRNFLEKNHIWYNFLDIDQCSDTTELLANFDVTAEDFPILINSEAKVCKQPSLEQLARYTGVLMDFEDKIFDVLVVGAGPSGLAASVYAASEGLSVVTIEREAPGGQAGKSSKIENYLGFPTGISGSDLANRAYVQAQKFGCNISIPHAATEIKHNGKCFEVRATNGKYICAKAVIVATGANYRKLPLHNLEQYEGSGVYYSATEMDATSCKDEEVGIIGGGNSAGQAALFLADHAKCLHMFVRRESFKGSMSDYLVQRIEACDNIDVHFQSEVKALEGAHHLESIGVSTPSGEQKNMGINHLFSFIGASPHSGWMENFVVADGKGFICTGSDLKPEHYQNHPLYANRTPQSLESSHPGLFAVGDVRKGSVKRVASAVGEGSMAVSQVHAYLRYLREVEAVPQ